jgi:hypothetical protein
MVLLNESINEVSEYSWNEDRELLCDFADTMRFSIPYPPAEIIQKAILSCESDISDFPLEWLDEPKKIMEELFKIMTLAKIGDEVFAWTLVSNDYTGFLLEIFYSADSITKARKMMGINSHWFLYIDPEYRDNYYNYDYFFNQMYDVYCEYREDLTPCKLFEL